jgi:hypothetical protein
MKQVLIETHLFNPSPLTISENKLGKSSNLIVEGLLATAEVKNGNGRYYSKDLWEREIDKYMSSVNENRALGELDHPDSSIINLKNVSHNIKKIWWNEDKVMGLIEILPTPSGNILTALFQNKIPVGVSSRGMGSLKQMGDIMEVQDDFDLLCWDFVSTPSNPGSYMAATGMMNESLAPKNQPFNKYNKVNSLITDILCSQGTCPVW